MSSTRGAVPGTLAWLAVWLFWLVVTSNHHPSFGLAFIVTTSLISVYAVASAMNQFALVPRFWRTRRYFAYSGLLLGVMASLTAVALAVIRISYYRAVGPDPDPNGLYVHYAIDFLGMTIHVAGAAVVVWLVRRWSGQNG